MTAVMKVPSLEGFTGPRDKIKVGMGAWKTCMCLSLLCNAYSHRRPAVTHASAVFVCYVAARHAHNTAFQHTAEICAGIHVAQQLEVICTMPPAPCCAVVLVHTVSGITSVLFVFVVGVVHPAVPAPGQLRTEGGRVPADAVRFGVIIQCIYHSFEKQVCVNCFRASTAGCISATIINMVCLWQ